ncbi:ribonuclease H-like domain-containing protein [Tanacetum coccineum]
MLAMKEGCVMSILDAIFIKEGTRDELIAVSNLAMRCLNLNGKNRPTMKEVALERGVLGAAPCVLPNALSTMANRDPTWNMDTDPNWPHAMYDEYNALIKSSTWVLVLKPPNVNVVRSMWLFRHKYHVDGSLSMYKARLVANGRSQQFDVDCDDTFSPVVKPATIRTVMRTGLVSRRFVVTRPCSYINMALRNVIISKEICFGDFGKAHMANCNPTRMPVDTESKLGSDRDPISDPTLYRSLAGDNLLSLSTKKQHTLSRSSAEVEYRGVANVVAETAWLHNLLKELHTPLLSATLVYCDNVRVLHVPSRYQYDIFTKELPSALFEEFRTSLSVRPSPTQTAGAYY